MECPRCRTQNVAGSAFCDECGLKLDGGCPRCGEANRPGAKFCRRCGEALAAPTAPAEAPASRFDSPEAYTPKHLAEKILTSRSALEGERKQVTVLFADLKGSMELLADRDPEEARTLLDAVLERMMEAVHRYEGTVNQVMGDGIMALFGAPLAHEDHAVRACYAALRMQASVARYAEELQRTQGAPVQIRVGLNSGEVVVRAIGSDLHMDYTAVGQTTHLAARMEQAARPGTIFAAGSTVSLVEGYVLTRSLGPLPIKGREAPLEVFEIVGAEPVRSRVQAAAARGLTRFVGRQKELAELRAAFERAGGGQGQVVTLVGKPGVGKSRLAYEFVHASPVGDWLVLQTAAASYGKSVPYLPVVDLLKSYFEIQARDDAEAIQGKIRGRLDPRLHDALEPLLALVEALPGKSPFRSLDPPERRERTLDAVGRLFLREARVRPVLLVVDNLEWADSETLAVLDTLVQRLGTERVMLVGTHRPEYQPAWADRGHHVSVAIETLPPVDADELLVSFLGDAAELEPLKRLLVERTGSNPLFLEESLRTLVETGGLAGERGAYRLAKPLASIEIPPTVQAIIAARIDRLAPEDKRLLQTAAVLGRQCPHALLAAIAGLAEEELQGGLHRLQRAEFLDQVGTFPDVEYVFAHALTQDVAYTTLLHEQRRGLHAAIVGAVEKLYARRIVEQVERLAHHAFHGEAWSKAVDYSQLAGLKAMQRAANQEAVVYFEQALRALDHFPESPHRTELAVDLRLDLRPALLQLGRLDDVLTVSREAEALAEELGDEQRLARVYVYLINYHYLKGEPHLAIEYGERCFAIAERRGDRALESLAGRYAGLPAHAQGDYRKAEAILGRNLEALDGSERAEVLAYVTSAAWIAFALIERGEFELARTYLDLAQRTADETRHAYSQAIALTLAGLASMRRGALEQAIPPLERSLETSREKHLAVWQPIPSSILGLTFALLGRKDEGLELLEAGVRLTRNLGIQAYLSLWTAHLAEGLLLAGQREQAREVAERAIDLAFSHGEPGHQAWALRILGEILSRDEPLDLDRAEASYRMALDLAEDLGMRPLLAHCQLGLARIYRARGDREKAEDHLTAATADFWQMDMRYWLRLAEHELTDLGRVLVVARDKLGLYEWLAQEFQDGGAIRVILDRRQGERRQHDQARAPERRQTDRRRRAFLDSLLRSRGLAVGD
jgi:class 3 adenylate cyclase/tetratricopeptide (TPR) repeat protein